MNQEELTSLLYTRLASERPFRLFISGNWGVGKTHAVTAVLKRQEKPWIYFSLFGYESLSEVRKQFAITALTETHTQKTPPWYKRLAASGIRKVSEGKLAAPAVQAIASISNFWAGTPSDLLGLLPIDLSPGTIIVVDDLERFLEPRVLPAILGFFERLRCSLVILANTAKVEGWKETVFPGLERVIDESYSLDTVSPTSFEAAVSEIISAEEDHGMVKFKEDIQSYFLQHGKGNLRTLRKCLFFLRDIADRSEKAFSLPILKTALAVCFERYHGDHDVLKRLQPEFLFTTDPKEPDFFQEYGLSILRDGDNAIALANFLVHYRFAHHIFDVARAQSLGDSLIQKWQEIELGTFAQMRECASETLHFLAKNHSGSPQDLRTIIPLTAIVLERQAKLGLSVMDEPALIRACSDALSALPSTLWEQSTHYHDLTTLVPSPKPSLDYFSIRPEIQEKIEPLWSERIEGLIANEVPRLFSAAVAANDLAQVQQIWDEQPDILLRTFHLFDILKEDVRNHQPVVTLLTRIVRNTGGQAPELVERLREMARQTAAGWDDPLAKRRLMKLFNGRHH